MRNKRKKETKTTQLYSQAIRTMKYKIKNLRNQ